MHLTIFLKHGQTLRFENVTDLKKRGIFSTKDVLGLSVNKEDFDVNSLF